jgi:hypothetical protein
MPVRGARRGVRCEDVSMVWPACAQAVRPVPHVETFPRQPLVLVCGRIEYCGEVIRRASCWITCGHRNEKEKFGSAQVVKDQLLNRPPSRGHAGRGQVTFPTQSTICDPHTCSEHGQNGENIQGPASIQEGGGLGLPA